MPPERYEPTKEERQSHEATHCPFRAWCEICVKAKSPEGNTPNSWVMRNTVLQFSLVTRSQQTSLVIPTGRFFMMVATESIHGSIFAVVARKKGGQDDYVMQSFQNYIDRLGLLRAELNCDQEPSTLDVANTFIKRCQSTILMVTATPKGLEGSLGRGERANLTIQGQLRAFRENVWNGRLDTVHG